MSAITGLFKRPPEVEAQRLKRAKQRLKFIKTAPLGKMYRYQLPSTGYCVGSTE